MDARPSTVQGLASRRSFLKVGSFAMGGYRRLGIDQNIEVFDGPQTKILPYGQPIVEL